MMEEKIFVAGFGGQGVVVAGNVLAHAALEEGRHAFLLVRALETVDLHQFHRVRQFIVVRDRSLLRAIAQTTAEWLHKIAGRLKNPVWRKFYLLVGATKDEEEVKRWATQFDDIAERMGKDIDLVLYHAPALILFHADKRIRFANENANLAVQNATLVACSLGLGSFYTGYVVLAYKHDRTMRKLLPLPEKHRVYGGLALGYPAVRFSQWIERNPAKITWL